MECSHELIGNIVIPSFVYNITRLAIMLVKLISNNSDSHSLRHFPTDAVLQIAPLPACQADLEPPFSANLDENHFFQIPSSFIDCFLSALGNLGESHLRGLLPCLRSSLHNLVCRVITLKPSYRRFLAPSLLIPRIAFSSVVHSLLSAPYSFLYLPTTP